MKLAVISDTHDHRDNILKAVSIMNKENIEALIHCGDYCSPFIKRWFDGLNEQIKKNFFGVFGNNDGDHEFLRKNLGQICSLVEGSIEIIREFDGKKIFASHMPTQKLIESLANSSSFDIVLSGHTHAVENKKNYNGVLIVNPGEACGYLTGTSTFAIIDTNKMEAEIIEL
ncbi:MAG: metallophosphoesterase [Candidatus Hodarchaeota archaeon]